MNVKAFFLGKIRIIFQMLSAVPKFQRDLMKTVGGVIQKRSAMDRHRRVYLNTSPLLCGGVNK